MRIPTSFQSAADAYETRRRGAQHKTLGHATRLYSDGIGDGKKNFSIVHWSTSIVIFTDNHYVKLRTEGHRSVTTKARINAALCYSGWRVGSLRVKTDRFVVGRDGRKRREYESLWWVFFGGKSVAKFIEGIELNLKAPR